MIRLALIAPTMVAFFFIAAVPGHAAGLTVVKADLWNKPDGSQGITLSTDHVKPGKVQFQVTNVSTDEDHELLLVKTDLAPADFPVDASGARVDEDKFKGLKELGDVHPGKSRNTTVTLKSGHYVLFCNEQGHFGAGMFTAFIVEQ
ncbi:plastocyanin/azurin family copper-binding protein [Rhizobium sp. RAF56]|uniref:plastocyanin/azurin family copper-binding protein n=1 Tax=Rhizobium sp. RAF56 TaxID=3233062 RepID=UPI003F9688A0